MSHSKIREDKSCQNCGRFVAERFCPNCGQENVENRQNFHYLFVHFFHDFIHYDSLFWKTIKSLFFPAKLTKEYLAGKRKSQVSPVQLYIFISFVVFFIPAILPDFNSKQTPTEIDTELLIKNINETYNINENYKGESLFGLKHVKSVEELDSIQQTLPKEKKLSVLQIVIYKKVLTMSQIDVESGKKINESFIHNLPKAVFLYMPVFAFWLWLFHSKKKWLYFDHGIYTLHCFSLILIVIFVFIIVKWVFSIFHAKIPALIPFAMYIYFIYYFFHSHRLMYMKTKAVSRFQCVALLLINTLCMIIFFLIYSMAVVWVSTTV